MYVMYVMYVMYAIYGMCVIYLMYVMCLWTRQLFDALAIIGIRISVLLPIYNLI